MWRAANLLAPPRTPGYRSPNPKLTEGKLYGDALVFDGHVDTPLRIADDGIDFGARQSASHVDLPRMVDGGLDAVFMAA